MLWSFWRCAWLVTSSATSLSTWTTLWLEPKFVPNVFELSLSPLIPWSPYSSCSVLLIMDCSIAHSWSWILQMLQDPAGGTTSCSDPEHNDNAFPFNWSDSTSERHEVVSRGGEKGLHGLKLLNVWWSLLMLCFLIKSCFRNDYAPLLASSSLSLLLLLCARHVTPELCWPPEPLELWNGLWPSILTRGGGILFPCLCFTVNWCVSYRDFQEVFFSSDSCIFTAFIELFIFCSCR